MISIDALVLKDYIMKIFSAAGSPDSEAEIIADH